MDRLKTITNTLFIFLFKFYDEILVYIIFSLVKINLDTGFILQEIVDLVTKSLIDTTPWLSKTLGSVWL